MNEPINNELTPEQSTDSIEKDKVEEIPNKANLPETKPSRSTQQALRERSKRTKRISLRNQRSLIFDQDPRFHYREVIDKGGRIEKYKRAGYELDEKPDKVHEGRSKDASNMGKYRNRIVGTTDTGHEIRAYIMRIPKEWYEVDQKEKLDYLNKNRDPRKQRIEGVSEKDTRGTIIIDNQFER